MIERMSGDAENTYTARLHLVGSNDETGGITYRTLQVHGLDQPHLEAVQAATINDPKAAATYGSLAEVPDLFIVDFPAMAMPRKVTPAWLSHEKRQLHDAARDLGEDHVADNLLHNWLDAHLRTTHVADTSADLAEGQRFITANKAEYRRYLTANIAERLLAFTVGPGRKNRTPAISGLISLAADLKLLPVQPPAIESRVDIARIAVFQLLVANEQLPLNYTYLLSSYSEAGELTPPEGTVHMPAPDQNEEAELRHHGFKLGRDKPLTRKAVQALLRLRVDATPSWTNGSLVPYPVADERTPEQIDDARNDAASRLSGLPNQNRQEIADTPEHRAYLQSLGVRWQEREQHRLASIPKP